MGRFSVLSAHAAQILREAGVRWRLGEDLGKPLGRGERTRSGQGTQLRDRTSRNGHGESLASFGATQHLGDVVAQLALGYDRHVGIVAELLCGEDVVRSYMTDASAPPAWRSALAVRASRITCRSSSRASKASNPLWAVTA